jgi:hypothetical protein
MDNNNEIMSKLKFIGKLKKGQKINTYGIFVQPEGFLTSFTRTFLGYDNRINTYNFIIQVIERIFEILRLYKKSENKSELILYKNIIEDLEKSTVGLENLKLTYSSDIKFCCDIDTILQTINSKIVKCKM